MTRPRLPAHPVPANVAGILTGSRGEFKRFPPETVDSVPVTWRESHNAQSLTSHGGNLCRRRRTISETGAGYTALLPEPLAAIRAALRHAKGPPFWRAPAHCVVGVRRCQLKMKSAEEKSPAEAPKTVMVWPSTSISTVLPTVVIVRSPKA